MKAGGRPDSRKSSMPGRKRPSPADKRRVNPQVQRTRKALQEGLLALLGRKPIEQITNQELAAKAKVGYASFFRHYSSKEELLREIIREQIGRMFEVTVPLADSGDTGAACLSLFQCVDQNREAWTVMLKRALGELREELIRMTPQRRPQKNRNQNWVPLDLGVRIGVASTIEIITWWIEHPGQLSIGAAADVLNRMVVEPALTAA